MPEQSKIEEGPDGKKTVQEQGKVFELIPASRLGCTALKLLQEKQRRLQEVQATEGLALVAEMRENDKHLGIDESWDVNPYSGYWFKARSEPEGQGSPADADTNGMSAAAEVKPVENLPKLEEDSAVREEKPSLKFRARVKKKKERTTP